MSSRIKKILLIFVDVLLLGYLGFAITSFNKPDETAIVCNNVIITIADAKNNGFIDKGEVLMRMRKEGIYPKGKPVNEIDCRNIEEVLKSTPFIRTVDCYKTQNGDVNVSVTQRMPILRIKAGDGADYYIDDKDCIMPKSDCTADLIVATGNITSDYAKQQLSPFARNLMSSDFARNLVEQINITEDKGVEIVPRLGQHIVYLGHLPKGDNLVETEQLIEEFAQNKFERLEKFYKYGLSKAGWDIYSDINLEYNNQIICKRVEKDKQ